MSPKSPANQDSGATANQVSSACSRCQVWPSSRRAAARPTDPGRSVIGFSHSTAAASGGIDRRRSSRHRSRGTGFDAWAILEEQKPFSGNSSLVFPYNWRSVGTAFRRACKELRIKDLKFHDLRHEAASRLFEAGFTIEQAALVTGHKDWKMLKRYTHLRPEHLRSIKPKNIPTSLDIPAGPTPADIALGARSNPERRVPQTNSAHSSQVAKPHHEHEALGLSASI